MSRRRTITAEQALLTAGIDPTAVRRALPDVDPARAPIRPAPTWYRRMWARGIVAVTMPWGISVTPEIFARLQDPAQASRHGPLIVHELAHLDQFRRLGATRHVSRYVGDYLTGRWRGRSHWDSYLDIGLEAEARAVAARFTAGTDS